MLYHASGTTSGTLLVLHNIAASIVYHIVQYCISYHIVLLQLFCSLVYHTAQSCISYSIVLYIIQHSIVYTTAQILILLLLLYISYYCTPIIYIQILLYSYHIHINSPYHVYGSHQTYVLFTLHISLLIYLQQPSHATSQLFSHDITQLHYALSFDAVK